MGVVYYHKSHSSEIQLVIDYQRVLTITHAQDHISALHNHLFLNQTHHNV